MRITTKKKLQKTYPKVKMSELIDIAYNTSPLSLEVGLRELQKRMFPNFYEKKSKKKNWKVR